MKLSCRCALLTNLGKRRCGRLFARLILVPDQKRHDKIDNREQDKPDRMRVGVTVGLVNDERGEEPKRERVGPQSSLQETCDQKNLDQAVYDKISACK